MGAGARDSTVELRSGTEMPVIGLGTWQFTGDEVVGGVSHALEIGYRLIDTAVDYENQSQIGEALRSGPVPREEIFLTSKVEENEDAYDGTRERLEQLGVERLDLCLLHRPPSDGPGVELWRGLLRAKADGLADEIGVSNYTMDEIHELIDATGEAPAVNQVEWSPFGHSDEFLAHSREHGIVVQAYSPLTRGKRLDDPELAGIAGAHSKTPAQVLLRWNIQMGTPPVPKAASADHREQNLGIFDFELSETEMRQLHDLNEHYSSLAGLPYV